MLIKANTLKGFKLNAKDGEIGKTKDFYFDDNYWAIRYLVADTGNWLFGNQVLISPHALKDADKSQGYVNVDLTKKQIEESPSIVNEQPISRQFEEKYHNYYGYPIYWTGPYMWGSTPYIGYAAPAPILPEHERGPIEKSSHLRSINDVEGYSIRAKDGNIGKVSDFLLDDQSWEIKYLVIDTNSLLPIKKVLLSPGWAKDVSWKSSEVYIDLPKATISAAPEYTDETDVTEEYMKVLHSYYNL